MKLSKLITEELTDNSQIKEINSAIKEIEEILSIENTRKQNTLNELSSKNTSTLNEYLKTIEENIFNLNAFVEILNSKKRLLEYETKRAISFE